MMSNTTAITRLHTIRNHYGKAFAEEKERLLNSIDIQAIRNKTAAALLYESLLFLAAYPDTKAIYKKANQYLGQLQQQLEARPKLQYSLSNSGITGTTLCAAFSFEMVKWLRSTKSTAITLNNIEAPDAQVQSILSVVMRKVESEILQDANAEWEGWLKKLKGKEEDLLDQLIAIFDSADIRSEVKDELWNTLGINVAIDFTEHCCLPDSLIKTCYHRSLIRQAKDHVLIEKPIAVKLAVAEAEKVMDCCRMILVRKLRELDPISFTDVKLVSYYQLQRGYGIALMGMVPRRRHPIDSYMGYVVFKNGLPVAYAGSWILFNSARIGLNIFTDYRGGESKYIFDQVLQLHAKVYGLKRFSVDPYQVGKYNSDGIDSGVFWLYYQAGFRPVAQTQYELAEAEAQQISENKKYRTPAAVLITLADSRLQLILQITAVDFDATDLSRAYAAIIIKKFAGNRLLAEKNAVPKIAAILLIKNYTEPNMNFVLSNWAVLLLSKEKELRSNKALQRTLKKLFILKASGSEEAYIKGLQQAAAFRIFVEGIVSTYC